MFKIILKNVKKENEDYELYQLDDMFNIIQLVDKTIEMID